jgi:hypothetical protein
MLTSKDIVNILIQLSHSYRLTRKNVRWVSYHFEKESELYQTADDDLFRAFDFLKGNDS